MGVVNQPNLNTVTAQASNPQRGSAFEQPKNVSVQTVPQPPSDSKLTFSPTAWAKLVFLRDLGHTEVGTFAITPRDRPLYIEDVRMVKQTCTAASVTFDDDAVADYFEEQDLAERHPEQYARIWMHTHPGMSATPSSCDETTFRDVFKEANWAVMFIVGKNDETYCSVRFNVGPRGRMKLDVTIDFKTEFKAADHQAWKEEYEACVQRPAATFQSPYQTGYSGCQHYQTGKHQTQWYDRRAGAGDWRETASWVQSGGYTPSKTVTEEERIQRIQDEWEAYEARHSNGMTEAEKDALLHPPKQQTVFSTNPDFDDRLDAELGLAEGQKVVAELENACKLTVVSDLPEHNGKEEKSGMLSIIRRKILG